MAQGWRYQPWWSMTGGSLLSLCRSTSAFRQVWRRVVVDVFADDGPVGDGMHRDLYGRLALACWQVSLVEGEADVELVTPHRRLGSDLTSSQTMAPLVTVCIEIFMVVSRLPVGR